MFLREHYIINLVLFQDHRYLSLQQQFDANQKLKLILEGACGIRAEESQGWAEKSTLVAEVGV